MIKDQVAILNTAYPEDFENLAPDMEHFRPYKSEKNHYSKKYYQTVQLVQGHEARCYLRPNGRGLQIVSLYTSNKLHGGGKFLLLDEN